MKRFLSALGIFALLGSSLFFASLNSGQRVIVRLGFATLYGVPLTAVAFGSVIAGMVVMLVAGIRSDLKVRRILRARLQEEDREERDRFVDHSQQDLFDSLPPVAAMSGATPVWDDPPPVDRPLMVREPVEPPPLPGAEGLTQPPPLPGAEGPTQPPPLPGAEGLTQPPPLPDVDGSTAARPRSSAIEAEDPSNPPPLPTEGVSPEGETRGDEGEDAPPPEWRGIDASP